MTHPLTRRSDKQPFSQARFVRGTLALALALALTSWQSPVGATTEGPDIKWGLRLEGGTNINIRNFTYEPQREGGCTSSSVCGVVGIDMSSLSGLGNDTVTLSGSAVGGYDLEEGERGAFSYARGIAAHNLGALNVVGDTMYLTAKGRSVLESVGGYFIGTRTGEEARAILVSTTLDTLVSSQHPGATSLVKGLQLWDMRRLALQEGGKLILDVEHQGGGTATGIEIVNRGLVQESEANLRADTWRTKAAHSWAKALSVRAFADESVGGGVGKASVSLEEGRYEWTSLADEAPSLSETLFSSESAATALGGRYSTGFEVVARASGAEATVTAAGVSSLGKAAVGVGVAVRAEEGGAAQWSSTEPLMVQFDAIRTGAAAKDDIAGQLGLGVYSGGAGRATLYQQSAQITAEQAVVAVSSGGNAASVILPELDFTRLTSADEALPSVLARGQGASVEIQHFHPTETTALHFLADQGGSITHGVDASEEGWVRLDGEARARNGGHLRINADSNLLLTNGRNTATLSATSEIVNEARRVASPTEENLPEETPGVVDAWLDMGRKWTPPKNRLSSIDTLTLNGGIVDLTASDVIFAGDELGTNGHQALVVDRLRGIYGRFVLKVDASTLTSQVITLVSGSEVGEHTIEFLPVHEATPSDDARPILVVRALNGLTNPEAYQATFRAHAPVDIGPFSYDLGKTTTAKEASVVGAATLADEQNTANWYLYPAVGEVVPEPHPEPLPIDPVVPVEPLPVDPSLPVTPEPLPRPETRPTPPVTTPPLNRTARGFVGVDGLRYMLATDPLTFHDRVGERSARCADGVETRRDVVCLGGTQTASGLWVQADAGETRLSARKDATYHVNHKRVHVGAEKSVGERWIVGGYFGYQWVDSRGQEPASLKGTAVELGLTATRTWDNGVYVDVIGRVGRTEGKFTSTDSLGRAVHARDLTGHYVGLTAEVGQRWMVSENFSLTPHARLSWTRVGETAGRTDSGLSAALGAITSTRSSVGATADWHFNVAGHPMTAYAKAAWEREWTAKSSVTFNRAIDVNTSLKESRTVYGLGISGDLGKRDKGSGWQLELTRSTGRVMQDEWRVNAGVRWAF